MIIKNEEIVWELIRLDMERYPGSYSEEVSNMELQLAIQKMPFVPDKNFLKYISKYGCGEVGSGKVYGLKTSSKLGINENVLQATNNKDMKYVIESFCGYKGKYLVISHDGSGNPYFMAENGSIWWAEWDCATGRLEKVTDDFLEFVWNECYDKELKELILGKDYKKKYNLE